MKWDKKPVIWSQLSPCSRLSVRSAQQEIERAHLSDPLLELQTIPQGEDDGFPTQCQEGPGIGYRPAVWLADDWRGPLHQLGFARQLWLPRFPNGSRR